MIGLTLTAAVLLVAPEVRQDQLFRSWEKAKADTRSLVVEFTLDRKDRVRNETVRLEGTVKVLRTVKGGLFASYTVKQADKPGAPAQPEFIGLLSGGNVYILQPGEKWAMRFAPEGGDVRHLLERRCNPFALLLDEKHAREKYRLGTVKQDQAYTYLEIEPKRSPGGWMPDLLMRGRAVVMNKDSEAVPKDMPRQLWYEDPAGSSYTYDIHRWKANAAGGPKADEFTRPEDRPGWNVQDCPCWLLREKKAEMRRWPPPKVGYIYIVGNDVTYQNAFLDRLGLYCGASVTQADLRAAERRLIPLRLLGITCSVTTMKREDDDEYADILVNASESAFTQVAGRAYNVISTRVGILLGK